MNYVMREQIENVKLLYSEAKVKQMRDIDYLMELKTENLLFSYYTEAGLGGWFNYKPEGIHWGWDGPLCAIRGTFAGHWLSAAARVYQETGHQELKVKADFIVKEIARCQENNGGEWAFPIPEKYLYWLKKGHACWAPQYVCHKTMMGLLDMYQFAGNEQALEIILHCADWFLRFTDDIPREMMNNIMDIAETGGIMEFWADLYAITKDPRHLELVRRYERPTLMEPLYEGIDVLTNMHANTTIPEMHGCARAYEVTGEERYRKIVENYWELAVEKRGTFATGGNTSGEVWGPIQKQTARLGELNQEHCTVYNMIRLANYLYTWTGESKYQDYIERNIENGLFAQGFWEGRGLNTVCESVYPDTGLVAYYLPLAAGSQKKWGSKTEDFWCCHCTLVQANTRYREWIFYQGENMFTVAQYMPAEIETDFAGVPVKVVQTQSDLGGDCTKITEITRTLEDRPNYRQMRLEIHAEKAVSYGVKFRIPWWIAGEMKIFVNGEEVSYRTENHFAILEREWQNDVIEVVLPKKLTAYPLPDEPDTVAFLDGPVVLAGLVGEERLLYGDVEHPETMLRPYHEREWTTWTSTYKTYRQPMGFYLKPIKDIGKEIYTVYFPVEKK